jgi:hypothetical protein
MGVLNISDILDLDSYANSWHILENKGQAEDFLLLVIDFKINDLTKESENFIKYQSFYTADVCDFFSKKLGYVILFGEKIDIFDALFVANENIFNHLVSWYLNQRVKNLENIKNNLSARFLLDNDLIGKSKSNAYSFIKKKEKLGLNELDIPDSVYID